MYITTNLQSIKFLDHHRRSQPVEVSGLLLWDGQHEHSYSSPLLIQSIIYFYISLLIYDYQKG